MKVKNVNETETQKHMFFKRESLVWELIPSKGSGDKDKVDVKSSLIEQAKTKAKNTVLFRVSV